MDDVASRPIPPHASVATLVPPRTFGLKCRRVTISGAWTRRRSSARCCPQRANHFVSQKQFDSASPSIRLVIPPSEPRLGFVPQKSLESALGSAHFGCEAKTQGGVRLAKHAQPALAPVRFANLRTRAIELALTPHNRIKSELRAPCSFNPITYKKRSL
jgi:hypothetical protein